MDPVAPCCLELQLEALRYQLEQQHAKEVKLLETQLARQSRKIEEHEDQGKELEKLKKEASTYGDIRSYLGEINGVIACRNMHSERGIAQDRGASNREDVDKLHAS